MATSYPSNLDALTNPGGADPMDNPSHADQHTDTNDAIEALQAKVGIDSSAVVTSHDYLIAQNTTHRGVTTGNPHSVTKTEVGLSNVDNTSDATKDAATATLTNKTLTTPTIGDFTNATHDHSSTAEGGGIAPVQEDWHIVGAVGEPAYQNSWEAYDGGSHFGGAEFMKDSLGFVHIRGLVKRSVGSSLAIFTLPAGYRPNRHVIFAGYGTAGVNRVDVEDTGEVIIQAGAGASYNTLCMIIFKAEV